jgi:hypothetical protein
MEAGAPATVINVAYGFEYLAMAANCARSVKKSNPDMRTHVITNVDVDPDVLAAHFDIATFRDEGTEYNRHVKTSALSYATSEFAVLVDSDAEVVGDLGPMVACLDRFDVAIKVTASPTFKSYDVAPGLPGGLFPCFHGGVVFFRVNERSARLFATWHSDLVDGHHNRDQPSLARAVHANPDVRLLPLNAVWNATDADRPLLEPRGGRRARARIDHYRQAYANAPSIGGRIAQYARTFAAALPASSLHRGEAERVLRKYDLVGHPLFRNPLTRRAYLALRLRLATAPAVGTDALKDRGALTTGRGYEWVDEF